MLTPTEKSGLNQILDDFTDSDLFSLLYTVSKGLLNATDRTAATTKLLSCLEKPSDLLHRQKVTKKILFSYLLKIKPFVSPESSKPDLVKMCLKEWQSIEECRNSDYENQNNSATTDNISAATDNISAATDNISATTDIISAATDNISATTDIISAATDNISATTDNNPVSWLNDMGIMFAQWFFPMYNTLQDFGPEHFWLDCRLMAELKTGTDRKEVTVVGANEVVGFLKSLIMMDRFYFDANTSRDSVTCEQDPHGLVRILVSGVVHQLNNCIGLFDSFYGLVRNPAHNDNWKIKWFQLKIHVNRVASLPHSQPLPSICPGS